MKRNMGNTDRAIRILIAIGIAILYFTHVITGTLGYILLGIAAIFVITSLFSFCPLYTLLGISSCKTRKVV